VKGGVGRGTTGISREATCVSVCVACAGMPDWRKRQSRIIPTVAFEPVTNRKRGDEKSERPREGRAAGRLGASGKETSSASKGTRNPDSTHRVYMSKTLSQKTIVSNADFVL
jgi:hypothetical protein